MSKFVVAVSGGVDSVVLLDMLTKESDMELIVAHFDHGIRDDSHLDAEFVRSLAAKYNLLFEIERVELGAHSSEELARKKRYDFLRRVADKYQATLITAHHSDDVIETIAINLSRGTGWRGLASMDSDIVRPLTNRTKLENLDYAAKNKLKWQEDSTNKSDKYLRNRLRQKLVNINDDEKRQLLGLWQHQKSIKHQINQLVAELCPISSSYQRDIFNKINKTVALEIIRHITFAKLTRPQMLTTLNAINNYLPAKKHFPGGNIIIDFSSRNFTVKLIK